MSRLFALCLAALLFIALPTYADPPCYGPGDVNADTSVDAGDLDAFVTCMPGPDVLAPPPGCNPETFARADLDPDGDVDLHDFAALMPLVGHEYFDYGPQRDNLEAEMLAMDVSGRLRAPDAQYDRILRDLALIRAAYPALETVIDDTDWVPRQLLVGLNETEPLDDYYALNDYYLLESEEIHYSFRLLTFCENLNAPVLGDIYAALPAVEWAEANGLIGIDDFITITLMGSTYRYHIDDGFMDCFDGCDCHRDWLIDVDEPGTVRLISYQEWGMPWCDFSR
jgi:hypothetical protein